MSPCHVIAGSAVPADLPARFPQEFYFFLAFYTKPSSVVISLKFNTLEKELALSILFYDRNSKLSRNGISFLRPAKSRKINACARQLSTRKAFRRKAVEEKHGNLWWFEVFAAGSSRSNRRFLSYLQPFYSGML